MCFLGDIQRRIDHGRTSRPTNKGDYTNKVDFDTNSSGYTRGLKCLYYILITMNKKLRGEGVKTLTDKIR